MQYQRYAEQGACRKFPGLLHAVGLGTGLDARQVRGRGADRWLEGTSTALDESIRSGPHPGGGYRVIQCEILGVGKSP